MKYFILLIIALLIFYSFIYLSREDLLERFLYTSCRTKGYERVRRTNL